MISILKKISLFKNTTFLEKIFFGYIIIFPFYAVLRALVYDTPFWRDVPISLMFFMVVLSILMTGKIFKFNLLDLLVLGYLGVGLMGAIMSDLESFETLKIFRTYFYVCLLYFVARYIFTKSSNIKRFNKAVVILTLLLAADVIMESIMVNVFYIDVNIFPWYAWSNLNLESIGYQALSGSRTIFTRIPTIYGYAHGAMLLLGGLTVYLWPYLLSRKNYFSKIVYHGKKILSYRSNILLLIFLTLCIFLGYVKLVIMAFILVIISYWIFFSRGKFTLYRLRQFFIIILVAFFSLNLLVPAFIKRVLHSVPIVFSDLRIYGLNPFYFFTERKLSLIGPFKLPQNLGDFIQEVRVLQIVLQFGLIWFLIFASLNFVAFRRCLRGVRFGSPEKKLFFLGAVGFLFIYFSDMFHYALAILVVNMDMWLVFLAAIASVSLPQDKKYEELITKR